MADSETEEQIEETSTASRMLERWRIFGHVVFQLLLMIVIFGQLNYVSCKRHGSWDLTQNRKFTLQTTTEDVLKGLDTDVKIVMAFLGSSELFQDTKGLVNRYGQVGGDRVSVEVLDLSRSKDRLSQLRAEYGLQFSRDQIVLISDGGRMKTINSTELVRRDPATNRVKEFRGEEILTSAVLEVSEKQQRKVYLIGGDRTAGQIVQIAGQFQRYASAQNAQVETLVLEGASEIPSDAEALIFAGNSVDISKRELELVKDFWLKRKGGLLVFLDPLADTPNLSSLLREHGVVPNNDRVLEVQKVPGFPARKSYDVPAIINSNLGGAAMSGKGPNIPAMATLLGGQTQSLDVRNEDKLVRAKNIWPSPLMMAKKGYWGESQYEQAEVAFDETQDNGAPVWVGASVQVGEPGDAELKNKTARMVVVGNGNVINPEGNTQKISADFAMASLNWVINREALTGIAPRAPSEFTLSITPSQLGNLKLITVFILPILAIGLGIFVWQRRRA